MAFNFKLEDLPENTMGDFAPVPAGDYEVIIEKVELKATKDQTGEYLNFQFRIVSENYNNRVLFAIVNVRNKSEKAESIGRQQLRQIMEYVNIKELNSENLEAFITKFIKVTVKIEEYNGEQKNVIKGFKKIEGANINTVVNNITKPAVEQNKPVWMK